MGLSAARRFIGIPSCDAWASISGPKGPHDGDQLELHVNSLRTICKQTTFNWKTSMESFDMGCNKG